MRRRETWLWLTLSVLGALFELTLFWLMVRGTSGMPVPWVTTTFIYGAAYLTGAATSPGGGVGGFESTAIALLHTQGVLGPAAVAAALLQRAADKGVITLAGFAAWYWVRRHIRRRRGLLLGDVVATGRAAGRADRRHPRPSPAPAPLPAPRPRARPAPVPVWSDGSAGPDGRARRPRLRLVWRVAAPASGAGGGRSPTPPERVMDIDVRNSRCAGE